MLLSRNHIFRQFLQVFWPPEGQKLSNFSEISISSCPTHFQCFHSVKSNLVEKSRFHWAETIYFGQFCKFFGHQRAKNYQIFLKFPLVLAQPTFNAFILSKVIWLRNLGFIEQKPYISANFASFLATRRPTRAVSGLQKYARAQH